MQCAFHRIFPNRWQKEDRLSTRQQVSFNLMRRAAGGAVVDVAGRIGFGGSQPSNTTVHHVVREGPRAPRRLIRLPRVAHFHMLHFERLECTKRGGTSSEASAPATCAHVESRVCSRKELRSRRARRSFAVSPVHREAAQQLLGHQRRRKRMLRA